MASKLQFISELASHTAQTVTRDVDGWKQYLLLPKKKLGKQGQVW